MGGPGRVGGPGNDAFVASGYDGGREGFSGERSNIDLSPWPLSFSGGLVTVADGTIDDEEEEELLPLLDRAIYYAKYYGKGGGWSAGEKN